MPRFFDDYSNTYLTHDSAAGRKQQRRGWKFRENFKLHYEKYLDSWRSGPMGLASAQQAYLKSRQLIDEQQQQQIPSSVPPLPKGWKEEWDDATHSSYYLHIPTGRRTWVRPGFRPPPVGVPGSSMGMNPMNHNNNNSNNPHRMGPPMGNLPPPHRGNPTNTNSLPPPLRSLPMGTTTTNGGGGVVMGASTNMRMPPPPPPMVGGSNVNPQFSQPPNMGPPHPNFVGQLPPPLSQRLPPPPNFIGLPPPNTMPPS
jgi:U1 small nuclear ribonucleoprotein C